MVLIALNVAVWIAILATGGSGSRLLDWLVLRPQGVLPSAPGGYSDVADAAVRRPTAAPGCPGSRTAPTGSW